MSVMLSPDVRERFRRASEEIGKGHNIDALAEEYLALYQRVIATQPRASGVPPIP
jgi:hypothetical protein